MSPEDPCTPPKSPAPPQPPGGRVPLRTLEYLWFFLPAIVCVTITILPPMLEWTTGDYPIVTSGLIGIGVGALLCLITGVQFGSQMKTGGPFVSAFLWVVIVTAVNSALAWGGCAAALSAL